jgi:aspartokinase-like uncharacterized kinase
VALLDVPTVVVVKVGGSLFSLPDLGPRLRSWLDRWRDSKVYLIPGGGATADVIRSFDRTHSLGEETAHWLALRALSLNVHLLQAFLPNACIIDPFEFAAGDEPCDGHLPHCWAVTSDSVAARFAVVSGASHLILLKSTSIPEGISWEEAGKRGFVDTYFAQVLRQAPALEVCAVNLRAWHPEMETTTPPAREPCQH